MQSSFSHQVETPAPVQDIIWARTQGPHGRQFTKINKDGTESKHIWIDRHTGLLGPIYKSPQYIPLAHFMQLNEKRRNLENSQSKFKNYTEATKAWISEGNEGSPHVTSITFDENDNTFIHVRAATQVEIAKENRDVDFWLQVYGVDPASISTPEKKASTLHGLESVKAGATKVLCYNGFYFGRSGPTFRDSLALFDVEGDPSLLLLLNSFEPLKEDAEVSTGVQKMRAIIKTQESKAGIQ